MKNHVKSEILKW